MRMQFFPWPSRSEKKPSPARKATFTAGSAVDSRSRSVVSMPPGSSTQVKRPPSGSLCLVPAGK